MLTVGHRLPSNAPIDETVAFCDYCGSLWYRSKLRRDGMGLLVCPQEGNGRDVETLRKLNEEGERARRDVEDESDSNYSQSDPTAPASYVADLDRTTPAIVATTPSDGATVAAASALLIQWSKAMNPSTGQVHVYSGGTLVESVNASASSRVGWVTTIPIAALASGSYYVLVDDDAFLDLNFVAFPGIAEIDEWEFTVS